MNEAERHLSSVKDLVHPNKTRALVLLSIIAEAQGNLPKHLDYHKQAEENHKASMEIRSLFIPQPNNLTACVFFSSLNARYFINDWIWNVMRWIRAAIIPRILTEGRESFLDLMDASNAPCMRIVLNEFTYFTTIAPKMHQV